MRRPRRAAPLVLATGLLFGAPALTACADDGAESNEVVENDVEDLDDEGAVPGVDEQTE